MSEVDTTTHTPHLHIHCVVVREVEKRRLVVERLKKTLARDERRKELRTRAFRLALNRLFTAEMQLASLEAGMRRGSL